MSPPTTFQVLIANILPCLRSKDHYEQQSPPRARSRTRNNIACTEYSQRFFLSTSMAPTTRRQSRLTGGAGETKGEVHEGIEMRSMNMGGRKGSKRVSRKSSVGKQESEEMIGKVDEVVEDIEIPPVSPTTTTQPEHASPHAHFAISPEPELHQETKDVIARASPNRRALKERTQSMGMTDILEAPHQEDEVQEAWEERDQCIQALHRSSSIVTMGEGEGDNEYGALYRGEDQDEDHGDFGDLEIIEDVDTVDQNALKAAIAPSPPSPSRPPTRLPITAPPSITERPDLYAGSSSSQVSAQNATQSTSQTTTNYNPAIQYITPTPVAQYEVTYKCGDCEADVVIKGAG